MKIVIDARELRTSTGRYVERLLHYLQKIDKQNGCGAPVAVSDIPVFHEVAGEAIQDILGDKPLQAQLIAKSEAQLKKFNWDDVAREIMGSFGNLLTKEEG